MDGPYDYPTQYPARAADQYASTTAGQYSFSDDIATRLLSDPAAMAALKQMLDAQASNMNASGKSKGGGISIGRMGGGGSSGGGGQTIFGGVA